jgi:XTP/dITP diphosphohydrolase
MRRLVLASGNPGKLAEIRAILAPLALDVVPQDALGIAEAEEPHDTFLENALAKARHASRIAGLPALADDSGLCVPVLGGEPGVHSAYYAGRDGDRPTRDARNNTKLLAALAQASARSAYYACVMVLVRHADDPLPVVAEGLWRGVIGREARGSHGFGYDPLFVPEGGLETAAELAPDKKNRVSHRGLALASLLERLRDGTD